MACLRYLQLVALAIVGSQAIPFNPLFGVTPFLTGHPPPEKKPLSLTCSWVDSAKGDAIAVTIKEKPSGHGGIHDALLSHVGGFAGLSGKGKLMATIDIFTSKGGPVSIAFTEKARPERGCHPEDFGYILTPKDDLHGGLGIGGLATLGGGLGGYGTGYGGYGGYGAGYGAGYGGVGYGLAGGYGGGVYGGGLYGGGLYGGALGGLGGIGFGKGHGDVNEAVPGVVADLLVSPNTASTVNIDNLAGFNSLEELAGRGVIVCPSEGIDSSHYGATCEGYIPSCCALHYDMGEQRLSVSGGPAYPPGAHA